MHKLAKLVDNLHEFTYLLNFILTGRGLFLKRASERRSRGVYVLGAVKIADREAYGLGWSREARKWASGKATRSTGW